MRDFGLEATIQQPADLVVNGRKISGNGAGDVNGYAVYIGNILLNFDRLTMVKVLRTANKAFREYTRQSMESFMTTMTEELGYRPEPERVEEQLLIHFKQWLPDLVDCQVNPKLQEAVHKEAERLMSDEVLSLPGKRLMARQIKIKEGVFVRLHGYFDGRNRGSAIMRIEDGVIRYFEDIDMDCLRRDNLLPLAPYITGVPWQEASIREALQYWYDDQIVYVANFDFETLVKWLVQGII